MTNVLMTNDQRNSLVIGAWSLVILFRAGSYSPGAIFSSLPCLGAFSLSPFGPMTVMYSVPSGAKARAVGLSRLVIFVTFTPPWPASMRNRPPSSGFIQAKSVAYKRLVFGEYAT